MRPFAERPQKVHAGEGPACRVNAQVLVPAIREGRQGWFEGTASTMASLRWAAGGKYQPLPRQEAFASHLSRAGTQASKVLLPEAELPVPTTLGSAWKHLFDLLSVFLCRCLAGGALCSREGRILHLGQHGPGNLQEEEQEGGQGEVCGTIIFGQ